MLASVSRRLKKRDDVCVGKWERRGLWGSEMDGKKRGLCTVWLKFGKEREQTDRQGQTPANCHACHQHFFDTQRGAKKAGSIKEKEHALIIILFCSALSAL
jgi:hypothetical protein